ncbi:DotG/IcmE/VirB10 family protein, partial [Photobacterium damselae]
TSSEFGVDGFNSEHCNRQGLNEAGELCKTTKIGENGLDEFGFNAANCNSHNIDRWGKPCDFKSTSSEFGVDGFNSEHCNRQGLNEAGELCKTTKIGENGLDEFGFNAANCNSHNIDRWGKPCDFKSTSSEFGVDGFNSEHCNRQGLNEAGELCKTPVYGADNLDEFGFNQYGCNLKNLDRWGKPCDTEILKHLGKFGVDGFNSEHCNRQGLNEAGELCKTPKIGSDGVDEFGFNAANCNSHNIDRWGKPCDFKSTSRIFGVDGFNSEHCNRQGLNEAGELCKTPKIGSDGVDEFGFNAANCNSHNLDRWGKPCGEPVYDPITGKDQYGYNRFGCSDLGRTKDGKVCNPNVIWGANGEGIDGKNKLGYNVVTGLDSDGYNEQGYDLNSLDRSKCKKDGKTALGFSCETGLNDKGFDENGCSLENKTAEGLPCIHVSYKPKWGKGGYNSDGVNKMGFNEFTGLNSAGVNELGIRPNGLDRLNCDPVTNLDPQGYNCTTGLNSAGIDKDGYDANGLKNGFGRDGKDADGYGVDGFNDKNLDRQGCNRKGERPDGTACSNEIDYHLTDAEKSLMTNYVKDQGSIEAMLFADAESVSTPKMERGVEPTKLSEKNAANTKGLVTKSVAEPSHKDSKSESTTENIRVPAYTLLKGQVACDMDSDFNGDACVKITGGALRGAKFYGTFAVPNIDKVEMDRDKIQVHFDTMVWNRKTYEVDAVAVNRDSMSQYLSSSVDYHYVFRWGGLVMGTAFDLSKAILIGNSMAKSDGNAMTTSMILNGAAAQPFDEMSEMYHKRMVRRPTVRMYKGEDIGVLFKKELTDKTLPYLF